MILDSSCTRNKFVRKDTNLQCHSRKSADLFHRFFPICLSIINCPAFLAFFVKKATKTNHFIEEEVAKPLTFNLACMSVEK